MATLEKGQRHFKNPGLASLEFECLPTLRRRAACSKLFLVLSKFGLLPNHNPSPTFWTSDARARNAISHFKIIGRFASWTSSFWRCSKEAYAMATLPRPSEPAQSPFAQTPGAASQHSTSGEDPRHFPVHAEELDSAQENRPRQSRWTRDVSS